MTSTNSKASPINYEIFRVVEEEVAAGIPEIMIDLIETFLTDSRQQLQAVRNAADAGDFETASRSAHSLKSTLATFGAESIAAIFADIEAAARQQEREKVLSLLPRAEEEWPAVQRAIEQECRRLRQGA